jgi:superfamily II DNA or RNA helicase
MAIPILRPYQSEAVDNVFKAWDSGLDRVAISAATGAGKSVILAAIAREYLAQHPGKTVVLLAHRRELILQAAKHFRKAGPDLKVETIIGNPGPKGSTKRAKTVHAWRQADVLVSTVQTLGSATTLNVFPDPDLIIVDEAHRSLANQYTKVLTALGAYSGTKTLGVTATAFREDHREFDSCYQAIVANIDIGWLIGHCDDGNGGVIECEPGNGYLMMPVLHHLLVDGLDLSDVPMSSKNGAVDFREGELAEALQDSGAFDMVVRTVSEKFSDRKGAIFAPNVESSKYLAELMTASGLACHHIDGTMDTKSREKILSDFRQGRVRWLSNVNIITEGFDVPDIDMVVLARPTRSRIFFRQAIGRALRPAPGKTDAIVLDVAGASDGMSLVGVESLTDADIASPGASESLSDLLQRSDRERRGRFDRIRSHASRAQDLQNRAERMAEQVRLTEEAMRAKLPGLEAFVDAIKPRQSLVLDHTTAAIDRFLTTREDMTLKQLEEAEEFVSGEVGSASKALSNIDEVKSLMRHALSTLKEDPASELSQALVTGEIRTVRGNLFESETETYKPVAPGDPGEMKTRNGKQTRASSYERYGWALRSKCDHLFVPVHGEESKNKPVALMVAVRLGSVYYPVRWDYASGSVDELAVIMSEDDSYALIIEKALEETTAENLVNPNAAWRKKAALPSSASYAYARRLLPQHEIPENVTAGYLADMITHGRYNKIVDDLGRWVKEQQPDLQEALPVG